MQYIFNYVVKTKKQKKLHISLQYHMPQTETFGPNRWAAALIFLGLNEATVFQRFPAGSLAMFIGVLWCL